VDWGTLRRMRGTDAGHQPVAEARRHARVMLRWSAYLSLMQVHRASGSSAFRLPPDTTSHSPAADRSSAKRREAKADLCTVRQWRIVIGAVPRDPCRHVAAARPRRRGPVSGSAAGLVATARAGTPDSGSGGLRKLRWGASGRGKRGGLRLIYYWAPREQAFYMLYVYAKSEQSDLTPVQVKTLRRIVPVEFP
jgi:hypothetical protein